MRPPQVEPDRLTLPPPEPPEPPQPVVDVDRWQPTVDCENGGEWFADSNPLYMYGLQFHPDTFYSHGGGEFEPSPTRAELAIVAERVLASHESDPWPNCPNPPG